jgi:hypothetical protein
MSENPLKNELAIPVSDLKSIVKMFQPATIDKAANEIWLDAAVTGSFSFSSGGANSEGWITYYDGTKIYFKVTQMTAQTGTAAGTFALPWVRVRPSGIVLAGSGKLEISGFMFGGTYRLYCSNGQTVFQSDLAVISAAPWDYHLEAGASYTKG